MILCIMLNTLELLERITIFDFFALFVRQLKEIIGDSLPLAAMLAFIVINQTIIFWILDQNSNEAKYAGLSGFGLCLVDSYRLALGDFDITVSFVDNTEEIFLFWFIFFISTLVALLLILNMVIAVMGNTFSRVGD